MQHERHGAKQPERFNPAKAAMLDDPSRLAYLPVEDVEALLELPEGGTLVDFGAGTGFYARELALRRPDVSVIALDEQPEMLALLRAKDLPPNLRPESAFDGRADRILALNVLHELGDRALDGLAAMLGPDGRAVFIDWNADVDRPCGPPRDHVYSPAQAKERLAKFSWRVVSERSFPYHYGLSCSR